MTDPDLQQQLDAARKTIEVLSRRIQRMEGGGDRSPFHWQLSAYQARIEEETRKLQESQNWARLLVENAKDAIVGIDGEGRVTHRNPRAESMFGWKQGEALGKVLAEIIIPEALREAHNHAVQRMAAGGESRLMNRPVEVSAQLRDGSELPVEISLSTLKRKSGDLFVAIIRDISERKRVEKALQDANENLEQLVEERTQAVKQSEERFALAMQGANDALWDWNLKSGTVYYSPRWKSMLGYGEDELGVTLDTWKALVHPDDMRKVLDRVSDYLEGREDSFDVEMRMRHKNGRWITVLSRALLQRDADDNPDRLVGTHVDITELKRTTQALADSEKTYHGIFDSLQEAVYVLDESGCILDVNKGAEQMYGHPRQAFIGRTPEFLLAYGKNDVQAVFKRIRRAFDGKLQEFEYWGLDASGREFPGDVKLCPGEYFGRKVIICVAQDNSEKKHLESQLFQSQKMESIGVLVGGIAHDFNNMLGAIHGNIYLARFKADDKPVLLGKMDEIEQLVAKAADMVQQLLTFARKDKIKMSSFLLNACIGESFRLAKAVIPENIELELEPCSENLVLMGDPVQLQQVLLNLLNNARDAVTGSPHGRIVCSLQRVAAEDSPQEMLQGLSGEEFAVLTVRDNGCGIDPSHLDKIFDPFYTTKEVGKGTGLGLSMAYGAVKSHGGTIHVESFIGKGTAIHIILPLSESEVVTSQAAPTSSILRGEGETILLVDDEVSLRSATSEVLSTIGYQVLESDDGENALQLFAERMDDIDLLLTDVVMPRMGGVDLAKAIRLLKPGMPVILATGYDKGHAVAVENQVSGSIVVSKPLSFEELSLSLRRMLAAK